MDYDASTWGTRTMKDISDLTVKQIRIFGADRIPFAPLRTAVGQKMLMELFSWTEFGIDRPTGELIFRTGAFQPKDSPPIVVNSLQISDRRILLEVVSETEKATLVYKALAEAVATLDSTKRWIDAVPVVLVHETRCMATLEFEWDCLFSDSFLRFSKKLERKLSSDNANASIAGARCGLVFSFAIKEDSIRKHGISLSNKLFTVEPRANTPLSERRYITISPVDSDTHLALLRDFEALIIGKT
jgi:hypothetical protein